MAVIKSGNSTDQATIDPISKAIRVTNYGSDGHEITDHIPVEIVVADVTVVDNDLVGSFDATDYSYISLQLKGTWVGTVKVQASNDNGTWNDVVVQKTGEIALPYVTSLTGNFLVKIPILAKYLRVRATSYTSGIIEGTAFAYKHDVHTGQISSVGAITGSVGLDAGSNVIGSVLAIPSSNETLLTDLYLGAGGAVDVNSRSIRAQASSLKAITITNYTAGQRHVKLYNTSSVPVAGVGTPVIVLSLNAGGTLVFPIPVTGLDFSNGIGMTMTLGAADGNTSPTATVGDFTVMSIFT